MPCLSASWTQDLVTSRRACIKTPRIHIDIGTVGSWRGVDARSPRIRSRTQSESTVCLPRHQHLTAQVPADMDEHQETRTNHLSKD